MKIPLGEFRPDIAELDSGVAAVAENVYPGANSYVPVLGAAAYSAAMDDVPRGLTMAQQEAGTFIAFSGTGTKLTKLNSSTLAWDDVTRASGGAYTVPTDELWSYAQFGTDLIACNANDDVQVFALESASQFAALSGTPPKARIVGVVEGYVWLVGLTDDPFGGQWSGTENDTQWTAGSNNSDTFSIKDGGRIMNLAPASKIIVQERALRRIIHQPGDPQVFTFDKIEDAKGAIAPYSVIARGSAVGYLAEDGFWFNGEPIGKDKIDNFFFSEVNQSRLFSVLGAFDPIRPLLYWAYRTGDSDLYDRMMVYNWKTGRWSVVSVNQYMLSNVATPGVSLEGLDAPYPNLDTDLPYSLDSRAWLGGRPTFGVIGSDLKLSFFEGAALEATVETGEVQLIPGKRATTRLVRPIVDTSSAVARVGRRERLADSRSWSAESSMQSSGACPVKASGRHHRFRVRVPAASTWTHVQGVEVEFAPAGKK